MERHVQLGLVIAAAMAFVPAFYFFIRAAIHFVKMLGHFRSSKHHLGANLVPFLMPWMPQLFTEQGNVHRTAFNRNLLWFACCFIFIVVVYTALGIKPVKIHSFGPARYAKPKKNEMWANTVRGYGAAA